MKIELKSIQIRKSGSVLTASGFLWLIMRWSVFRTITTLDNEPQSWDELTVGIFGTSAITALIGLWNGIKNKAEID